MRTLNVRFLILLTVGVLGFCFGVYLLHAFQVRRNASVFLRQAEVAKEANRLDEALKYYQLYVNMVPADTDALEKLGMLLADVAQESRRNSGAYQLLEEVLRRDPERAKVRRRLVDVAITMRRYSDAKEHLQGLMKDNDEKDLDHCTDPVLWDLLGTCQMGLSQDGEAELSFKKAIKLAPGQLDTYAHLAAVLRQRMHREKEADQWMNTMVETNPKSARARLYHGIYLFSVSSLDAKTLDIAINEAEQALKLLPDDRYALRLAAQCALEKKQYEAARKYAMRGVQLYKNDASMYILLNEVELKAGQREEAVAVLRRGLAATNAHPQILWSMANLLIDAHDAGEAKKTIEALRSANYPPYLIQYLEARLHFIGERWVQAFKGFQDVCPSLNDLPGLLKQAEFWMGECHMRQGNTDQAQRFYRDALRVDPFYLPPRVAIADALMNAGHYDLAANEYRYLQVNGRMPPGGWLPLARALVLNNLRLPGKRDWTEAKEALQEAAEAEPDSAQVVLLNVEVMVAEDHAAEAEKWLLQQCESQPNKAELWRALATLAERQEKYEQARKYLDTADAKGGDKVILRLARGEYLVRSRDKSGTSLKQLGENISDFSRIERQRLWNGLMSLAMQAAEDEQAAALGDRLAREQPNDLPLRLSLFDLALRANDDKKMTSLMTEIAAIAGQSPIWRYCKAQQLNMHAKRLGPEAAKESLAEAQRQIALARAERPTWSRLPLIAGSLYEQQGNPDAALENYLEALKMGERNSAAAMRSLELLYKRQRFDEAMKLLQSMVDNQMPMTEGLLQGKVEMYLQRGEMDKAREAMEKEVHEDAANPAKNLWMGQVYALLARQAKAATVADKNNADAEKYLRKAVALDEKIPETWIALVQLLATTGQMGKAREVVAQAQSRLPARTIAITLAQCYEAMGDQEQAQGKYKEALDAAPNDVGTLRRFAEFYVRNNRLAAAEPLLGRLLGNTVKADDATIIWARRTLALVLVERRGYANLQQAIRLIDKNLTSAASTTQDRRVKVKLLETDPRQAKGDEVIEILKSLVSSAEGATVDDRFDLARLYLRRGDWDNYLVEMRQVVAAKTAAAGHRVAYLEALLQHNELGEAELYLNKLEGQFTDPFVTLRLRSDIMIRRKQIDRALALLGAYAEGGKDLDSDERSQRVLDVAGVLEQFADRLDAQQQKADAVRLMRQAEKYFRSYVEEHPNYELVLAAFFGRQGRIKEALEVIDRCWELVNNPMDLAQTISLLFHDKKALPQQLKAAEAVVQKALQKFNRPTALVVVAAEMYSTEQEYDKAEACYREVLAQDANDPQANNNLALLLAEREIKLDESLRLVNRAMDLVGPIPSMLDSRACVYIALGQTDKALADLAEAIADGAAPLRLFHQAKAYHQAGRKAEFAAAMEKANSAGLTLKLIDVPERPIYKKMLEDLRDPTIASPLAAP
ncbi:MAG: tetratricopeptide repeat protein [Thermoguttaceae bacterium]